VAAGTVRIKQKRRIAMRRGLIVLISG